MTSMAKVAKKRYNHYRQRHFLESLHGNNEHIPSDPMRDWVESRSKQGAYGNHSDYVRDLIRKDQLQVQKLKTMQDAITKGLMGVSTESQKGIKISTNSAL